MDLTEIKGIFRKNSDSFIEQIKKRRDNAILKNAKNESNISMFNPANDEFYKYSYYEKYLESQIYEYLINKNLFNLFSINNISFFIPNKNTRIENESYFFGLLKKRVEKQVIYADDNLEWVEKRFICQFIIDNYGERVGYRYTPPYSNNIEKDLNDYKINRIVVLDMKNQDNNKSRIFYGIDENYRHLVSSVKFSEFIKDLFGEEVYNLYYNEVTNAVLKANEIIGFQTIPNMSLQYLSEFKDKTLSYLFNIDYKNLKYEIINKLSDLSLSKINKQISDRDQMKIITNFKEKGLYKILVSNEDFAKSFITSEYLYELFKNKRNIDFTWIICGYVKSVEQLLYKFMKLELEYSDNNELWIKANNNITKLDNYKDDQDIRVNPKNKKNKIYQVKFKKKYEEYFDISLAPLLNFVIDNEAGWIVSKDTVSIISELLKIYSREDRNEHFHKDNIYSFEEVDKIKNNTIYILYLLLGAYKVATNSTSNNILGGYENQYEKLYKKIKEIPSGNNKYYLVFNDIEYKTILPCQQNDLVFDSNGNIISELKFIKVDDFMIGDYKSFIDNVRDEDIISVNVNNLPSEVFLRFRDNSRKNIFDL